MPKNTYLALTIGPIYKTLQKAKNTQSLWGASYLFSYLMKEICLGLRDKYLNDFIIPYVKDNRIFEPNKGAGLFPDRLIIRNGKIADLEASINSALNEFVENKLIVDAINEEIQIHNKDYKKSISKTNKAELKEYLYKYLLLGVVEIQLEAHENVIEACSKPLDTLELQAPYYANEKADWLYFLIQNISKTLLVKDAFGIDKYRFPSIPEIATLYLERKYPIEYKKAQNAFNNKNQEDNTYEELKKQESIRSDFRCYHKYLAIVKADGDNMGEAVANMYKINSSDVEKIDKALLEFNIEAIKKIDEYGGKSIYLGGDDLLFFAPVCSSKGNIFQLVADLSNSYNGFIKQPFVGAKIEKLPTLSFGISITYYKYPMNEALDIANTLLLEAKDAKLGKNAISFRVMKHSGQYFGTRFPQDAKYYYTFHNLLKETNLSNEESFLSSVMYRIREMEYMIQAILEDEQRNARLDYFFENNFNENIHTNKVKFLKAVADYIKVIYEEKTANFKLTIDTIYSTLRFIQFIYQKDTENGN